MDDNDDGTDDEYLKWLECLDECCLDDMDLITMALKGDREEEGRLWIKKGEKYLGKLLYALSTLHGC